MKIFLGIQVFHTVLRAIPIDVGVGIIILLFCFITRSPYKIFFNVIFESEDLDSARPWTNAPFCPPPLTPAMVIHYGFRRHLLFFYCSKAKLCQLQIRCIQLRIKCTTYYFTFFWFFAFFNIYAFWGNLGTFFAFMLYFFKIFSKQLYLKY